MAFHWEYAPANMLTNPAVDPVAKISEYKVTSIKAILEVLERAARDKAFIAALANNAPRYFKTVHCRNRCPVKVTALKQNVAKTARCFSWIQRYEMTKDDG